MLNPKDFSYFSTYLLAAEADNRGIKVNIVADDAMTSKGVVLELIYRKHKEYIVGQRTARTSAVAYWIQQNKQVAKYFFARNGISVSEGDAFNYKQEKEIIKYCKKIGYPVVIKPVMGVQGKSVYLEVRSDKRVREILKALKGKFSNILIEKQYHGDEYRLFATKDKFVAATWRIPANVEGDGVHNLQELIKIKNKDPRRGADHAKSLVRIKVDDVVKDYLKGQKKTLKYIPQKGQKVYLRPNSNLSTGGDSIDFTDKIHPKVKQLAVKVINAIPGLAFGGIDFMTKDITKAPVKNNYIIIEVNDSPMISMHHIPYEGKARNAAKAIIDMIFPETK
ncbi:hypothetical protein COT97_05155 [Candidatus Falkowbacteria bacterium CG10_big_fil_rev_8_21_14_0_10_39_11]|uniref:ATP-grasp domain-containing protein n=1 Tax=Candidatus Falkowbacteria bacterium CG10_big_fil_rev_8_21_14_0_10_39_11 TaxID=1974565 RepID=A0A2H0V3T8_9BACT|nr:MAG: hypothetical protein COT97_05155 [Candidatus Falkowbacteria bacterium CG10_big_fil_rev_8_21_14_0_10_39_11]